MALIDEARRRALIDQIPTGGMKAPAPDGSQNNPLNSDLGRNIRNTLNAIPGAAAVPGAAAAGGGLIARALSASAPAGGLIGRAAQTAAPYAPVVVGGAVLHSAANASNPGVASPAAPSPSARPAVPAASPSLPSVPSAPSAPAAAPTGSDVTREGNSYSGTNIAGDITINGRAPGGGQISPQNMAAADGLRAPSEGLLARAGLLPSAPPRGPSLIEAASSRPGAADVAQSQPASVQAPTVLHSGNSWQARNDLRNAQVSASSITNDGGRWDQHKGVSAAREYAAGLEQADTQARFAQPAYDMKTAQENANTQREGMQQAGANNRSLLQYALDQERLRQSGEAAGFENRKLGLIERMRQQVAAEQDPTRRRGLIQHMRDIEGRTEQADPYLVVPGGQQIDPATQRVYNTPASVFNRQTGQFVQQPGQGATQQSPYPDGQELIGKDGKTYVVKNGVPVAK